MNELFQKRWIKLSKRDVYLEVENAGGRGKIASKNWNFGHLIDFQIVWLINKFRVGHRDTEIKSVVEQQLVLSEAELQFELDERRDELHLPLKVLSALRPAAISDRVAETPVTDNGLRVETE